jgi:ribosomal protein S18 acetylase RimI-like enzyme
VIDGEPHVAIRPYRSSDRDAVVKLVERLGHAAPPWRDTSAVRAANHGAVARLLDTPQADAAVFVAENGADVVGFITVERRQHFSGSTDAVIGDLVVAEEVESRGIGAALIDTVESWARARGVTNVTVETTARNSRAQRLYQRLGFQLEDVRFTKPLR